MQQERLEKIRQLIDSNGLVHAQELAEHFCVSAETIRRDLKKLETEGYIRKIHGGAVSIRRHLSEAAYRTRRNTFTEQKKAIAKEAASLITPDSIVLITPGTTTLETAMFLKEKSGLTVVTNSLPITLELSENPDISVYLLGGHVRGNDYSSFGIQTIEDLKRYNPSVLLMGVGGITLEKGLTDYRMEESSVLRSFTEYVPRIIAVTDSSKFGVVSTYNICPAGRLDHLITDTGLAKNEATAFRNSGIDIRLV